MKPIKTLLQLSLASSCILLLSGCLNETVKCSDESVQQTIKEIYVEQIQSGQNNPLLATMTKNLPNIESIDSIRPASYDDEIKLRECKAVIHFDNGSTTDVAYSVQENEENSDEFYVELDTTFVESLLMSSIMQGLQSEE